MTIQGRINFSILQIFNPDLLGSGASVVNVAIRGPLSEPQVEGRLELRNASLFLRDVPNGIDQANGLILFDRNRATVQKLSAQTGGGDIQFETGSFVGFRGTALVYRLQAAAHNVRYRSGEGVSLTLDGSMALVGTSESSVLSGSVSVTRAAFNPRTDLGILLASTARPVAQATPNDYLNGVQFDIHIATTHTLEVETSLTRNIQADADVRLRGTPDRPVLLGQVTVNSGQVEFFGNKYSINRGEIKFDNPAKIEPVHQHGPLHPSARHHGGHQLLGLAQQVEFLLSFRSPAAGLRYHRAAGRGPHSRRRRPLGRSANRHQRE